MKQVINILIAGIILMAVACEKVGDFYLGMYQQPKLSKEGLVDGLNVFCVLRPDSIAGRSKSFAFVQQVWPALEPETLAILTDAEVTISENIDGDFSVNTEFLLSPPDSIFSDTMYRPVQLFLPKVGKEYKMVCKHANFPSAIGTCTIPDKPQIIEGTMVRQSTSLMFTLKADTTAKLIDVYLVNDYQYGMLTRIVPTGMGNQKISVELPVAVQEGMYLMVYYYDSNLATYYANSNTSVNFNKYRLGFSTLQSGYGVFGALNYAIFEL